MIFFYKKSSFDELLIDKIYIAEMGLKGKSFKRNLIILRAGEIKNAN
jgi:hypothetical protein